VNELDAQVKVLTTAGNYSVREAAARTLGASGQPEAVEPLLKTLEGLIGEIAGSAGMRNDPSYRNVHGGLQAGISFFRAVLAALCALDGPEIVPRVLRLFENDAAIKKRVEMYTGLVSPAAGEALFRAYQSIYPEMLLAIVGAFRDMGDKSAVPFLQKALTHEHVPVQLAAQDALARLQHS